MKRQLSLTPILLTAISTTLFAEPPDIDQELASLATKLSVPVADHGTKKITVVDFSDLHGNTSDLGKYIAEQLTVNFVTEKRPFSVLDRANLKSILAEHKLTSEGLVDPENAKQLGKFAGVDALILGVIIPKNENITLTAKVITTDTAEIVGAARAEFKADDRVQQLLAQKAPPRAGGPESELPKYVKEFGDLKITIASLRIEERKRFLLTLSFANQNPRKSIWVALSTDIYGSHKSRITDADGFPFHASTPTISGVASSFLAQYSYTPGSFAPATEIRPKDSVTATVGFLPAQSSQPADGKEIAAGSYNLQLEIIQGRDNNHAPANSEIHTLVTKLDAN